MLIGVDENHKVITSDQNLPKNRKHRVEEHDHTIKFKRPTKPMTIGQKGSHSKTEVPLMPIRHENLKPVPY
ncbi:hypothetical protein PPACK8108_LOCUS14927 [Phakopsora pachyrhizi]|uniref:Uncharacterized protein n=1 Tax=Phakopsora pachyrhizi TaxID=170000 RepID=A0AAV0B597_PHAPC|nr:hypothetical protein PPACK8108_LOCUS14927 [Phakopsora pachyrhizi]